MIYINSLRTVCKNSMLCSSGFYATDIQDAVNDKLAIITEQLKQINCH